MPKQSKLDNIVQALWDSGDFTVDEIAAIKLAITCVDREKLVQRGGTFALEGLDSLLEVSND